MSKQHIPYNAFEIMLDNYIYPVIVAATIGFAALIINIIKKGVENWTVGVKENQVKTDSKIDNLSINTSEKIDKISENAIKDREIILKAISSIEITTERITSKQTQIDIQLIDANDRINDIIKELREKDKDVNEIKSRLTQVINYHVQHHNDRFQ